MAEGEEIVVKPLPSLRLAPTELVLAGALGVLGVLVGISDLGTATPPQAGWRFHAAAFPFAAGLAMLLWTLQWAVGFPVSLDSVVVRHGEVRRQCFLSLRRAAPESAKMVVFCSGVPAAFHVVLFMPDREPPWSLVIPGDALWLCIAGWMGHRGAADSASAPP